MPTQQKNVEPPDRHLLRWWAKLAAKVLLTRLPVSQQAWKRIGLFDHGPMEDPAYALESFEIHFRHFREHARGRRGLAAGFTCLELGPGSSVSSAVIAKAMGAERVWLVDAADLALRDVAVYARLAEFLRAKPGWERVPRLDGVSSMEGVLAACGAEYCTEGLRSLRMIPDDSVDWAWSHTVLQHVALLELEPSLWELRRVMRADGLASHVVDFRDMLTKNSNHLTMPDWLWEKRLLIEAGVYTNRVLRGELVGMFERCGFAVETVETQLWRSPPIARESLQPRFRALADEDLKTYDMHVLLRPV